MSKNFLAVLAAIVVIFAGIFIFGGNKSNTKNNSSGSAAQATNHIEGQGKKGVTLIEYGDYQCPVCEAYYPTVKQVAAKYNADIYFQFRNLPLSQVHPNAFAAARAAESASLQNKFWQMHDILYDQQSTWADSSNPYPLFQSFAQQLGLDINKFKQDYQSSAVNNVINADLDAFSKTGQQEATPTFFINGKFVQNTDLADSNGPSVAKFSQVIDAAIAAKAKQ